MHYVTAVLLIVAFMLLIVWIVVFCLFIDLFAKWKKMKMIKSFIVFSRTTELHREYVSVLSVVFQSASLFAFHLFVIASLLNEFLFEAKYYIFILRSMDIFSGVLFVTCLVLRFFVPFSDQKIKKRRFANRYSFNNHNQK